MVIRKIQDKTKLTSDDYEALISRGATVKEDNITFQDNEWGFLNLRILKRLIRQIDQILKNRIGMTRTGWILEAIQEKLKREDGI